jgi:hypothetical protein
MHRKKVQTNTGSNRILSHTRLVQVGSKPIPRLWGDNQTVVWFDEHPIPKRAIELLGV